MSNKRDDMMAKIVKVLNLSSKATGEEKSIELSTRM